MHQTGARRILIIDPPRFLSDMLSFVLKYHYNDITQVVQSYEAGWASLETERPDIVFIYLWTGSAQPIGCWQWLKSLFQPLPAERPGLMPATEFCLRLRSSSTLQQVPVIVFATRQPGRVYAELQEAGATGYLWLPCGPDQIMAARNAVVRGETYYQ